MKSQLPRAAALSAAVFAVLIAPAAVSARGRGFVASASNVSATASRTTVTVKGKVRLMGGSVAKRRHAHVLVTLSDSVGDHERRSAKLGAGQRFRARWRTTLAGRLTVGVQAVVSGKRSGRVITRTVEVTQPTPGSGTPLVGTFKLAAGSAPAGQTPTGSYFEMLQSNGSPLSNLSSPAPNKDYTPLTPGTAGGFSTTAYQSAPSPAFSGGNFGNALADKIIKPVPFYLINFSVETSSSDAQLGLHDSLPTVDDKGGALSGQITAWDAQWNGESFNQGTPKPNGSVPPPTTALTGTYDSRTRQFTLEWKSLIVGGPFNGFTGVWHLTGTFVPASNGLLQLPKL